MKFDRENIKNFFAFLNAPNCGLWDILLNQVYPAVLGSFIYKVFEKSYGQVKLFIDSFRFDYFLAPDWPLIFKYGFILNALVFYYSDYFYIKYTNEYRRWFFIFDVVFAFILLATAQLTHLDDLQSPYYFWILRCYFTFLALYLIWDFAEWRKSLKLGHSDEASFYKEVIRWEGISIGILLILLTGKLWIRVCCLAILFLCLCWGFVERKKSLKLQDSVKSLFYREVIQWEVVSFVLTILAIITKKISSSYVYSFALILITVQFVKLTRKKKQFSNTLCDPITTLQK